jgi:hypothetical protein
MYHDVILSGAINKEIHKDFLRVFKIQSLIFFLTEISIFLN